MTDLLFERTFICNNVNKLDEKDKLAICKHVITNHSAFKGTNNGVYIQLDQLSPEVTLWIYEYILDNLFSSFHMDP